MADTEKGWPRRRVLKISLLAVIGIVALILIIYLSAVFIPVGIALLMAYVLEPVITFMDRHHSRRVFTVSLVYTFFLVLLMGTGVFIGPPLMDQGREFVSFVQAKSREYGITQEMLGKDSSSENEPESWWAGLFSDEDESTASPDEEDEPSSSDQEEGPEDSGEGPPPNQIDRFFKQNASKLKNRIPILAVGGVKAIFNGAGTVATFLTQCVLMLFYAFFFMLHFPSIKKAFMEWIPNAHRQEAVEVLGEVDDVVAGFFRGRLLVCVISAAVTSAGLLISGIDFWLILGIAAGFLGIIPFIGVTLTLVPSLLIAFASGHAIFSVIGVLMTFAVVQGIVEPFVGPFVISHKVRLHPVTVVIAFMAGGVLFGVLGILLAIPVCGILKILSRRYLMPAAKSVISE